MSKSLVTTKKDFETFKREFLRWQGIFGLNRFRLSFQHCYLEDSYADLRFNVAECWAIARFTTRVDGGPESIDGYKGPALHAFHECCHLLLAPLHELAQTRHVSQQQIDDAAEAVVCTMEQAFATKGGRACLAHLGA